LADKAVDQDGIIKAVHGVPGVGNGAGDFTGVTGCAGIGNKNFHCVSFWCLKERGCDPRIF